MEYWSNGYRGGVPHPSCKITLRRAAAPPRLATAVKRVGNEPFMYCTDFPHEVNAATCKKKLSELIENEKLSEADKDTILFGNAVKFYRIKDN